MTDIDVAQRLFWDAAPWLLAVIGAVLFAYHGYRWAWRQVDETLFPPPDSVGEDQNEGD